MRRADSEQHHPEAASVPRRTPVTVGWAAFVLRCVTGVTFIAHGIQKVVVLGWAGGVPSFRTWGIPWPEIAYPLTILVETAGGTLLLLGLWVRSAAAALTVTMLVALFAVHLSGGFFLPDGYEFVLTLAAVNVALVLLGPGRWALSTRLPAVALEGRLGGRSTLR